MSLLAYPLAVATSATLHSRCFASNCPIFFDRQLALPLQKPSSSPTTMNPSSRLASSIASSLLLPRYVSFSGRVFPFIDCGIGISRFVWTRIMLGHGLIYDLFIKRVIQVCRVDLIIYGSCSY